MLNDISILLQGSVNSSLNENINYYRTITDNVILSVYDDQDVSNISNCVIVKSVYDKNVYNHGNIWKQTQTTLAGIKAAHTKYIIKIRTDEYYHNIDLFYNKLIENESRLITSNVFFRPFNVVKNHISDHILCSTTDSLLSTFNIVKNLLETNNTNIIYDETRRKYTECVIADSFLVSKGETPNVNNISMLMKKYFSIIPVSRLKPYLVVYNGAKKVWRDNFDPIAECSIEREEQIG